MDRPIRFTVLLTMLVIGLAAAPAPAEGPENLLKNPAFEMSDGQIAVWGDFTDPPQRVSVEPAEGLDENPAALRIDIEKDGGKSLGQIQQRVRVKPNTTYQLTAMAKATKPGIATMQIKWLRKGKEIDRSRTEWNAEGWTPVDLSFDSKDATHVQVICRWRQRAGDVGATVWFAQPVLTEAASEPATETEPEADGEPTEAE